MRTSNGTGVLPSQEMASTERRQPSTAFDFEQMVKSLHELFEHDRQIASQPNSMRCGICYLHFLLSELQYRNEGYYICSGCSQTLGHQNVSMLHKQRKLWLIYITIVQKTMACHLDLLGSSIHRDVYRKIWQRSQSQIAVFSTTRLGLFFLPLDLLQVVAHVDLQADLDDR